MRPGLKFRPERSNTPGEMIPVYDAELSEMVGEGGEEGLSFDQLVDRAHRGAVPASVVSAWLEDVLASGAVRTFLDAGGLRRFRLDWLRREILGAGLRRPTPA